ncbi:bifunctional UDP-N-acetylglucosamine diphosphorylase/glucosamine-1-phosphate N-acetyltransferase GlmU [Calderihabitans maritimus]|uniref:Bifunctional protein GlmU n=1 Tax=Calderihabitans maritimus TaxID=1246530 RepID=A0A1Z5HQL1_9FIRM|nr:bifunctional UDP-N-acetylglucosamine diphosphorylase/glucosamine-1-phosphate N-acetyltransferase GlmU [Calderihabitans maritimus]GAW91657.1 UDP-N-acetylglucosamine pyrophosphorylase / glucosamine-1-phosphate N-acetyltransferase [Calderihabitans maritimus]
MVSAVVLAAGKGKRMRSRLPKVLHKVAGKYMVEHVLEALRGAGVKNIILVLGHEAELVKEKVARDVEVAYQREQLGTGHAVMQAKALLPGDGEDVLVVCGDTPLLTAQTLKELIERHQENRAAVTILTSILPDPTGYGRIVRGPDGKVIRIVEEKDATPEEREIREINTGTYCFRQEELLSALEEIRPDNAQGEYYLTDTIDILIRRGLTVEAVQGSAEETLGINNRVQLAEAEKILRKRINCALMEAGVTILDPDSTFIDAGVEIGQDTVILPFTFIQGNTYIGSGCTIGPGVTVRDSRVGDNVSLQYSVVTESEIGDGCSVGPYAYLRPGTVLAPNVKIGDFVEVKNSRIGAGSKVPHLSYIGDATIGTGVNIGAGTITCNYDGEKKWPTKIGDGAFIGSNTNLVAPVEVGEDAMVGAGSTITRDVPAGDLAICRGKQINLKGYARKKRGKSKNNDRK